MRFALACGVGLVALSAQVQGALVSVDWQSVDDQLIVQDTDAALEWLKLTETNNLSYNYVSSQLVSIGDFAGFRYATGQEVIDLFHANFGIDLREGTDHPSVRGCTAFCV